MAIKWSKVNWDLIKRLRNLAKNDFDNSDYIGASVIKMIFLEGTVNLALRIQLENKQFSRDSINNFSKYPNFPVLIHYFYAITKNEKLYKDLQELNQKRNKLIHELYSYNSFDILLQESRDLYLQADLVEKYIIENYWPKESSEQTTLLQKST